MSRSENGEAEEGGHWSSFALEGQQATFLSFSSPHHLQSGYIYPKNCTDQPLGGCCRSVLSRASGAWSTGWGGTAFPSLGQQPAVLNNLANHSLGLIMSLPASCREG